MDLSRRTFFKLAAAGGAAAIAAPSTASATASHPAADGVVGMLVDTTRCLGCRACEAACSEANGLAGPAMPGEDAVFEQARTTDSRTYTVVNRRGPAASPRFVKSQCMHCVEPACASACLVKALEKTPAGPVVYHGDRCIGCRYCMVACPFEVPKFEYEKPLPYVQKCTFCAGRLAQGQGPACAEVCPTGALTFGKRSELLEAAKERIYGTPGRYVRRVYGEHEAGGTSWMYIGDVPFEQLAFRDVGTTPYPQLTQSALSVVPLVVMLGPPFLMGLYTFSRRREQAAASEAAGTQETRHD
jgi:Fe-S-cluster-containing dehydrogenase component